MKRFEKVINYSPYFHLAVGLALAICGWSTSGVGAEVDQSSQTDVAKPVAEIETTIESVADLVSPDTWPMFRGTQGLSGVAPGKLSTSFKLAWSFATEDPIKSTAAIVGGKVYFGSDDGWVYALDLNSGSLLWKHETKGPVESSPLFLDGKIYVGSGDGFLYALNAADGVLIWKYETGYQILGAPNLALAPDGKSKWILAGSYDFLLHCVDSVTGKVVWTYEIDNYINGSPSSAGGVTVFG